MYTIVHFEIPARNPDRAKAFYSDLFGWRFGDSSVPNYWLIETDDSGVTRQEALGGGLLPWQEPYQGILVYIRVDSVQAYQAKVETLGGEIVFPRSPVPHSGWWAVCRDPEGNLFALWEADPDAI